MKKVMFLMLAGSLVMAGCKKEGCTDEKATNYNADAKKDDGSCVYPAPVTPTPAADTEAPTVAITKPAASTKVKAGENLDISATITDNTGATTWTYTIKDAKGAEKATSTAKLSGAKTETATETYAVAATMEAGTYTLEITAGDAAGNTSAAATASFEVEAAGPTDAEDPKINAITQKFPLTGTSITSGNNNNDGGKWEVDVSDDVKIDEIKVYLYNTTQSLNLDSAIYTGVDAATWKKEVQLQFDRNYVGDKAKVKVMVKDQAGKSASMESSSTYDLSL